MANFWNKFSKKPFAKGDEDASKEAAVAVSKTETKKAAPKKTAKAKSADKVAKAETKEASRPATAFAHVLVRPHLSEKAVGMTDKGTYVFEVRVSATAPEVKMAVKAIYGIMPIAVRMVNVHPRTVRFGRMMGTTRAAKKAIVTLPPGKKLDIYG